MHIASTFIVIRGEILPPGRNRPLLLAVANELLSRFVLAERGLGVFKPLSPLY